VEVERTAMMLRRLWAGVGALVLLAGCSVGNDSTGDASKSGLSQWNLNAGRFVPAGVVSFASLSADEICGLADEKLVSREFGFDFGGFEPSFELGERGARCGFDATSDGFEGDRLDVRWYVGPPERSAPNQTDVLTRSQSYVHGLPVSLSVNGETVSATLSLKDRVIRVETFTDNDIRRRQISQPVLSLLSLVHTRVSALRPRAQPAFDATVDDVLAFSPAQFCSLLRDATVKALNRSQANLATVRPDAFDVTALRSDFLWCSKGRGKLELQIGFWILDEYPDAAIRRLPSQSSIGLLDSENSNSEQTRLALAASRPIEGGVEERVITLIAQGTAYNAASREILRSEMNHIIGELNRRLPKPLIYKLEDGPVNVEEKSVPPGPISLLTEKTKVLTRLPRGFGEPL
jgi:hypothetical protein